MTSRDRELVLVVDDDHKIARLLEAYLERGGFRVVTAHDGVTALEMIRELEPALVVLDLMLPALSGRDVARVAREESDVSIIMLTAMGSPGQRVSGLESGADDYVVKPFEPSELVARVRSVLRRSRPHRAPGVLRYSDMVVDPARRLARVGNRPLELSMAEFDLLRLLVQSRGRVLTRSHLVQALSRDPMEPIRERSVDVYVRRLRSKLGGDGQSPSRIVTVRGIGYRLGGG
ncbi:MAG: response regulator transcription factor [Chloroflexota bacterium]